ncbi:MAG: hypothetical protein ACHQ1H_00935 [Nitrososphaerales archaeon]
MNFKVTVAVVVIIAVIVSVSLIYYETAGHTAVGSTVAYSIATQSGMNVQFVSNNLTVGFQSGLWQMSLKNVGTVSVSKMMVRLITPVDSYVCSGVDQSAGLSFANCTVAPSGNPLPPGATVSGSASGIGEGSGKVGSTYTVVAKVLFSNGDTVWVNSTVTATTPTG